MTVNGTTRLLPAALSLGVVLLLGAGCAVSGAATTGDAVTTAAGGVTDRGSVGTASSASATSGNDAGTPGSGTSGEATATGTDGKGGTNGTDGTGTDMDAVAITVLYAGTEPVLTSEFVRPMPNFVFTYGGQVVRSNRDGAVEGSVSPAQVRDLLERAEQLGLVDGGAVPPGEMVPDGPYAKVTLVHQGREVVLEAYSLHEEESDPTRKALRAFIEESTAVATDARGEKPYRPVSYLFRATPVQQDADAGEARPWPVDLVSPADAQDCAEITARAWGGEMATDANTHYIDDGQLYTVAAIPALPGQSC